MTLNPDVSKPLPAPDVTNSQLDFNVSTVNLVAFDNAAVSIDEIKLGTTLADVVPEPPVAGLILFPAALFLRRSERRRPAASRLPCPR